MRLALVLLGAASLWWSATVLPTVRSAGLARELTKRILADDRFRSDALSLAKAHIENEPKHGVATSVLSRAQALVQLKAADNTMQRQDSNQADQETAIAEEKLKLSLALNPTDSFLWLMLYSVEVRRSGFDPGKLARLDQSYEAGPREGWIALHRNRVTLAIFSMLNDALQEKAVSEFAAMVDSGFIKEAAFNLTGAGWVQQDRLLASLSQVDIVSREAFAKRLARDGVRVSVPGVEVDERWWR